MTLWGQSGCLQMGTHSAFPHSAVLSAVLRHSIDVNKVVMGSNSQEVTV